MSVKQRMEVVKKCRCCFNCLALSHNVAHCDSDSVCKLCKGKHHTLLHIYKTPRIQPEERNRVNQNRRDSQPKKRRSHHHHIHNQSRNRRHLSRSQERHDSKGPSPDPLEKLKAAVRALEIIKRVF